MATAQGFYNSFWFILPTGRQ